MKDATIWFSLGANDSTNIYCDEYNWINQQIATSFNELKVKKYSADFNG